MMLTIASSIDCSICYMELSTLGLKTISLDCQLSTAASEILVTLLSDRHLTFHCEREWTHVVSCYHAGCCSQVLIYVLYSSLVQSRAYSLPQSTTVYSLQSTVYDLQSTVYSAGVPVCRLPYTPFLTTAGSILGDSLWAFGFWGWGRGRFGEEDQMGWGWGCGMGDGRWGIGMGPDGMGDSGRIVRMGCGMG
jgi:hypothetical protein